VQALVRGDPAGHAERELAERRELRLPPGAAVASVTGDPDAVTAFVAAVDLPPRTELLGPVPVPPPRGDAPGEEQVRVLLQAEPSARLALAAALKAALAIRSARRDTGAVRVRLDPRDLG
jgi:primosomal protein N' (replication factor Y)